MRFDILTLFPDMCKAVVNESILGRAQNKGVIEINVTDIREFADNKHHKVDDTPYGGGRGMVMMVQPVEATIEHITQQIGSKPHVVYLSPKGAIFDQKKAVELSEYENLTLLCGHYEGVDQRIIDMFVDEEISMGDFVLTGGELPALAVVDAVARMKQGVLADDECFEDESVYSGLLEYPQYTRPANYKGHLVPEVLLSGHEKNIKTWRRRQALELTLERREDMIRQDNLTKEDIAYLKSIGWCKSGENS